jgi:FkbM family methyltransferase
MSGLNFLVKYYLRKHIYKNLTANDIFKRRLIRLQRKLPGMATKQSEDEVVYTIKDENGRRLYLHIRAEQSSDIQVMDQVFASREYLPLVEEIKKRSQEKDIRFIIDAGANVGYTSIYLKTYFPGAYIVAVEPDGHNGLQAKKNFEINNLRDIQLLKGGIWHKDAWLELKKDRNNGKEWAFHVVESVEPTDLRGFSIDTVLTESGYKEIDILKIDIEGSEKELFADEKKMDIVLAKTKFLSIEIHDETGSRTAIYESLKRNGFEWFNHGELTIATNLNIINRRRN